MIDQDPTNTTPAFTPKQLADWKAYERVRAGGRYNMFDPRARKATKLSSEEYLFTMKHYSELSAACKAGKP